MSEKQRKQPYHKKAKPRKGFSLDVGEYRRKQERLADEAARGMLESLRRPSELP